MNRTHFMKKLEGILLCVENKGKAFDLLSSLATMIADERFLLGGELKKEFKYGRLTITAHLRPENHERK